MNIPKSMQKMFEKYLILLIETIIALLVPIIVAFFGDILKFLFDRLRELFQKKESAFESFVKSKIRTVRSRMESSPEKDKSRFQDQINLLEEILAFFQKQGKDLDKDMASVKREAEKKVSKDMSEEKLRQTATEQMKKSGDLI